MEVSLTPLTAASRGVVVWLGTTVAVIAALTSAHVWRPPFPNEPPVVACFFLVGAFVGGVAVWRREPATSALVWTLLNAALAAVVLAFPVAAGLAV